MPIDRKRIMASALFQDTSVTCHSDAVL